MNTISIISFSLVFLASCTSTGFQSDYITEVYVDDFGSDNIKLCRPSDVDLNHNEAKEFFLRSKKVEYKIIHDHYNYAPCYIEGTLKYKSIPCEWEIRAGATGQIKCGKNTKFYVCDTCNDLFKTK